MINSKYYISNRHIFSRNKFNIQSPNINLFGGFVFLRQFVYNSCVEKSNKAKIRKIVKEYKDATYTEIWEGVRDNFIFGFLGATLVVFIATRTDIAVLLGYLTYYFFMGKIVNRPKYVTDLGRMIVFPIPSALGGVYRI